MSRLYADNANIGDWLWKAANVKDKNNRAAVQQFMLKVPWQIIVTE